MDWLDTETKALLQRSPPEKLAPPDTATCFASYCWRSRESITAPFSRAAQLVAEASDGATRLLSSRLPVCVNKGLSYSDAQIGQFELICCDAVSVIVCGRGDRRR